MTNNVKNTSIENLYEQDYPLWLEKTAQLLLIEFKKGEVYDNSASSE